MSPLKLHLTVLIHFSFPQILLQDGLIFIKVCMEMIKELLVIPLGLLLLLLLLRGLA